MNYKIHLFIHEVLRFTTIIGIGVLGFIYFRKLHILWFALSAIIGVYGVRFLWRLVPVSCPFGNCNGKAYCKGSRPVIYECSKCGCIHETSLLIDAGGGP